MANKQCCFVPGTKSPGAFPYTPAIAVGDHVYISGQGPLDPETGKIHGDTLEEQAELTLRNVERVLACAGATMSDVVKVTAYLSSISTFDRYNTVYGRFFRDRQPARTTVEAKLWGGILIEVDAIAIRGCGRDGDAVA